MIKKVGLYTLGCKVAQYETEAVAEEFERRGFLLSDFSEVCDVYVINTCTVTAEGDRKCRQIIRRASRKNPDGFIIVMGCYSQRSPDEVEKLPGVSAVIGTGGKMSAVDIAERLLSGKAPFESGKTLVTDVDCEPFEPMSVTRGERTRVYVKIEDGCECRCTYCAIPSARGRVRSKPRAEVISEVEALAERGICEIVLTGIETGSYGVDFEEKYTLCDLLTELDGRGVVTRIRLGSLAPELVGERFAHAVAPLKSLAPHFHISVQSGSDYTLRRMKRRYTAKAALENIQRLRRLIPGAQFTTDLMVGFPGESEEDFLETLEFVKRAEFIDCHVFAYSKRKNTPAAEFEGQIPEDVKRKRSERLINIAEAVRDKVLSDIVKKGDVMSCIVESRKGVYWYGHTASFAACLVKEKDKSLASGDMVLVRPTHHNDGIIYGEII